MFLLINVLTSVCFYNYAINDSAKSTSTRVKRAAIKVLKN